MLGSDLYQTPDISCRTYFHLPFSSSLRGNVLGRSYKCVRKPLYVVGAGDLGTTAANLDRALQQIFEVATAWKAIVLIDEVGPFLTDLFNYILLAISFFRLMFSLSRDRYMT